MPASNIISVITLIVLVAVGALVAFEILNSMNESVAVSPVSIDNAGSATFSVPNEGLDSAWVESTYNFSDTVNLTVTVNNDNVIKQAVAAGSGTIENSDIRNSIVVGGSNTVTVSVDNQARVRSLTTTLDVDTQGETVNKNLTSKGQTAFNLMAVLVIVLVAVLIIGAVVGAFKSPTTATVGI